MPSSELNHIIEYCKKGSTQQLLDALANMEDNNIIDERDNSLLCIALQNGQWSTFTALVENNYTFNPVKPILISACQCRKDDIQGIVLALDHYVEIDIQNNLKRTALMTACLLGHLKKVQELINNKASCTLQDNEGNTALIEAVQSKNKKVVALILQQNPDVNQTNYAHETALTLGMKQKSPVEDIIKSLLEAGGDPEILDNSTKSAWLIAKQKHPKISRLIENYLNSMNQIELPFFTNNFQKRNKKIPNSNNKTPPSPPIAKKAVIKSKHQETASKFKVEPIKTDNKSKTKPSLFINRKVIKTNKQEWFHAAKTGNLGGLNRMIIAGIDIDCTDDKGCTALIRASGHSRRAVVSFLLQQKASIELRSNNGSTALSSSIIGDCRRVAGLLIDNNANPNALGPSNYSYATIAAAQWNDAMLSILYRSGADIFIENKHQQNLLHIVALAAEFYNNINNAKSTIQFLLDHGMNINAQDKDGNSALMILCGTHKIKYKVNDRNIASIVHNIIKLGAAATITNKSKKSALDAAKHHKLPQTKGILMNAISWNNV
ncbi:MAG: ankyrin repeat domain-containing protein [Alcanivoracaceae bacterium]|nr:ankyrin repeat domain-containing protein [Alcanivoracaceae bacterium]